MKKEDISEGIIGFEKTAPFAQIIEKCEKFISCIKEIELPDEYEELPVIAYFGNYGFWGYAHASSDHIERTDEFDEFSILYESDSFFILDDSDDELMADYEDDCEADISVFLNKIYDELIDLSTPFLETREIKDNIFIEKRESVFKKVFS